MDTSPEYINMCRQANELQEMWEPMQGDFYYNDFIKIINIMKDHLQFNRDKQKGYSDAIWLPRIDQLITLLNEAQNEELHDAGQRFSECSELDTLGSIFHNCAVGDYYDKETFTVEQLFLVELYDTKYNKSWDGDDWI